MKELIIELSTDSLDKIQNFIENGEWESLCETHNITSDNWECNLLTIDIEELKEEGYSIPFIYFHLESDESQVYFQAEWYPDNSGDCIFLSSNVRDVLNVQIKDLWNEYDCIRFVETKDGENIAKYLGTEIHEN